ncbi:MAG: hypothetical protein ACOH1P_03980 [Lysobacter sp.]
MNITPFRTRPVLFAAGMVAASLLLLAAPPAAAQKAQRAQQTATGKKIYCWEVDGSKVCGDALPASAVDSPRTEFSPSGMPTKRLERAPTDAERAIAELEAARSEEAAWTAAERNRREQAMVLSFASESELQRNFENRIGLIDSSIKTSRLGIEGARRSLLNLLQRASESELADKPVPKSLADKISSQHDALRRHQTLLERQLQERGTIDQELASALDRYRELKVLANAGRD